MSFKSYAKQYGCSIAEAIHDRDFPMSEAECVKAFKQDTGLNPSAEDIATMRPDCQSVISSERELMNSEMFDWR